MKKVFWVFGIITALCTNNGYADGEQSVVAVYTCPDGCIINNDIDMKNIGCLDNGGKDCGNPKVNVFVPQILKTSQIVNKKQNSAPIKKQEPVSARAAMKPVKNKHVVNSVPVPGNQCPEGCHMYCDPNTTQTNGYLSSIHCYCVDENGNACN